MYTDLFEGALVRHFGADIGPLVICIHGFADDATAFNPLASTSLSAEFRVVSCDLPGFGASPPSGKAMISDLADFVVRLGDALSPDRQWGLIAHSVGSPIAAAAAQMRPERVRAVLSIEGNLTADDAYFSGRAAEHECAAAFKSAFSDQILAMAQETHTMRRYLGAVRMADADSMWLLGRDAARLGCGDAFGQAYLTLARSNVETMYFWGRHNTPRSTAAFVDRFQLASREFTRSGHWKSVDAPEETSAIARELFRQLV